MEAPLEHILISLRSAVILFYLAGFVSWLRIRRPTQICDRLRSLGWAFTQIAVVFFFGPSHVATLLQQTLPGQLNDILNIGGMICLLLAAFCFQSAGIYAKHSFEASAVTKIKQAVVTNVIIVGFCLTAGFLLHE